MKILTKEQRNSIIQSGKKVYNAYAAINLMNNANKLSIEFQEKKYSLNELVSLMTNQSIDIKIANKSYKLSRQATSSGGFKINIMPKSQNIILDFKPIEKFGIEELLIFISNHDIEYIKKSGSNNDYKPQIKLINAETQKEIVINSPESVDLYEPHIQTLFSMIKCLENGEDHMLDKKATGSGKTFTQILWFMCLYLAGQNLIISVPGNIIDQIYTGFLKLLPKSKYNEVIKNQQLRVLSHDELLTQFDKFKDDKSYISIDEQHKVMKKERDNAKIQSLAEKHPLLLLSATPSDNAMQMVGGKTVSQLTRAEKQKLGLEKIPHSIEVKADTLEIKAKKARKASGITMQKTQPLTFLGKIIALLTAPEQTSAAHEYIERMEGSFVFKSQSDLLSYKKPAESSKFDQFSLEWKKRLRWNLQSPIAEKALILVDDVEAAINLDLFLENKLISVDDEETTTNTDLSLEHTKAKQNEALIRRKVFKNGNFIDRTACYDIGGGDNIASNLDEINADDLYKLQLSQRQMMVYNFLELDPKNKEQDLNSLNELVDFENSHKFAKYKVMHGLVENLLEFYTGLNSQELDHKRYHDFDYFFQGLDQWNKLYPETISFQAAFKKWLVENKDLSDKAATKVALSVDGIRKELLNSWNKGLFFDNWSLDKKLHQEFDKLLLNNYNLENFVKQHANMYLFDTSEHLGSEIRSKVPFNKFQEKSELIYSSKGKHPKASQREMQLIEDIIPAISRQYTYTPQYIEEYDEQDVKNLFKAGVIGNLVGNTFGTGMDDVSLNHLGYIITKPDDKMNDVDTIIQGLGRLRGKRFDKTPFAIMATDKGVFSCFSFADFDVKNFFSHYLKLKKSQNHKKLEKYGEEIATKLSLYIKNQYIPGKEFDYKKIEEKAIELIFNKFETIYNNNNHEYPQSQRELAILLNYVSMSFAKKMEQMRNPNNTKFIFKLYLFVFKIFSDIGYWFLYSSKVKKALADNGKPFDSTTSDDLGSVKFSKLGINC